MRLFCWNKIRHSVISFSGGAPHDMTRCMAYCALMIHVSCADFLGTCEVMARHIRLAKSFRVHRSQPGDLELASWYSHASSYVLPLRWAMSYR